MKIYFVRHGIAEERINNQDHLERKLTQEGIKKTHKIAEKMVKIAVECDVIITSPYRRAVETAQILAKYNPAPSTIIADYLQPEGDINLWLTWLKKSNYGEDNNLILVGHEPDLSSWAEILIYGKNSGKITLKKSGIIGVKINNFDYPCGNSELFLLTSPKWII
ncbi:MAG: phosphohistidine phosphatase SixA [Cyanobacterium sp. T60_A2020_053]|nr:phosphohistidine phosphatase SixA [Cyanobacterium sp. T60_A2020_053]